MCPKTIFDLKITLASLIKTLYNGIKQIILVWYVIKIFIFIFGVISRRAKVLLPY